jgi:hypothetical protein
MNEMEDRVWVMISVSNFVLNRNLAMEADPPQNTTATKMKKYPARGDR